MKPDTSVHLRDGQLILFMGYTFPEYCSECRIQAGIRPVKTSKMVK